MIRVLVVDDSATMRSLISATLRRDPEIEVIGQAADPLEARQAIKALNPDVITLDVEMPNMNGLDFLEKIMRLRPMPVIMVSTLTKQGTDATLQALEIGAFDCVAKPATAGLHAFDELAYKVKAAAKANIRPRSFLATETSVRDEETFAPDGRIIAIGSSTGGVEALITVLSRFPKNCPPTVITQHMPATFTRSFAERLNRLCAPDVCEAFTDAPLKSGHIYLAPGGVAHLEVVGTGTLRCRLNDGDAVNGHRPSVDVLFNSVAKAARMNAVGVILTGMGRDGAKGLLEMRRAGAHTIGQDEATSVIYGMPKAAFEMEAVEKQAPLEKIAAEILKPTLAQRKGEALMPAASSIKILIVDDHQTMRSLVRNGLHQLGFIDLIEAADGEQALKSMISSTPPKLIISDFNMPKLDGLGLLRSIRAYEPLKTTAFIMLTGQADKDLVQRAVAVRCK